MDDAAELCLDIDLDRFLELLKVSSLTKATGPFSWQAPYKQEGVRVLFLSKIKNLGKDNVECRVDELAYRKPGHIIIAGRRHVITLYATRVREGQTYVLVKCQDPAARDSSFAHVVKEMGKLEEQLAVQTPDAEAAPVHRLRIEQVALPAGTAGTDKQPVEKAVSPVEPSDEEPWMAVPDHGWDRQALELWWEGYTVGDVASRLSLSEKTVRNRLTALRLAYGAEIVPKVEGLRKAGRR